MLTAFIIVFIFLREIPAVVLPRHLVPASSSVEGGFAILHPQAGGGVAFFAHVGGFVFGAGDGPVFVGDAPPLQPGLVSSGRC